MKMKTSTRSFDVFEIERFVARTRETCIKKIRGVLKHILTFSGKMGIGKLILIENNNPQSGNLKSLTLTSRGLYLEWLHPGSDETVCPIIRDVTCPAVEPHLREHSVGADIDLTKYTQGYDLVDILETLIRKVKELERI
jgi:hypothetical protein